MSAVTDPFALDLARVALAATALAAAACGLLGVLVLQRGLAYVAESIGHALVGGAALATAIGAPVAVGAFVSAAAAALGVEPLARRRGLGSDLAVTVIFGALLAGGVIVLARGATARLDSLLFGSIVALERADVVAAAAGLVVVALVAATIARAVVLQSFDADYATAAGVPTTRVDAVLALALALAVTLALRSLGALLALALVTAPPLAALVLTRRLTSALLVAPLLGVVATVAGFVAAFHLDVAPAPTIGLVACALVPVALLVRLDP